MTFGQQLVENLDDILYNAAALGNVISLETYLTSLPVEISLWSVNHLYEENGMNCTLLMIACLNRHENVVRMLLRRFHPELETTGTIKLGARQNYQKCEKVSALWTAAAIGSYSIVKLLVEAGSDVNFKTSTNSTSFRCACFDGNIEIARYLVAHGADWHIAKAHNDTNLMLCAHFKHVEMTKYLVEELGYDINELSNDRRTVLYSAVKSGSIEIVRYLLEHGAENMRDTVRNMNPLMWAAEKKHVDIVDVFADYCTELEWIEARELLGTAFVCETSNNADLDKAFQYLSEALTLRISKGFQKITSIPIKVFEYHQECQTVEELSEIRSIPERFHCEALLVRERLLGADNGEYRFSLRLRGAVLADEKQFVQAIRLWFYEERLSRQHNVEFSDDNMRDCLALLAELIIKSQVIPSEDILETLILTNDQLVFASNENQDELLRITLHTMLYLITLITKIYSVFSPDIRREIYKLICSVNQTQNGRRLLHLCMNSNSTFVSTAPHKQALVKVCKYPCLATAQLLVHCKADIDAADENDNTPLHILVSNDTWNDSMTTMLEYLCNIGVHLDCINQDGETPVDISIHSHVIQLLREKTEINLKCLCARLIRQKNLQYNNYLSNSQIVFVDKH